MLTPQLGILRSGIEGSTEDAYGGRRVLLPGGFFSALGAEEFIDASRVWTLAAGNGSNTIRWITQTAADTRREFSSPAARESIGF
jgi:hypothetical protein